MSHSGRRLIVVAHPHSLWRVLLAQRREELVGHSLAERQIEARGPLVGEESRALEVTKLIRVLAAGDQKRVEEPPQEPEPEERDVFMGDGSAKRVWR